MKKIAIICALVGAATIAMPASAQPSTSDDPNFGTINLTAGFNNDPRVIRVVSGGTTSASSVGRNCAGYVSRAPDVRLNYTAGSGLPLIISAASSDDTTLVVNGPNGNWHCDDDGGENGLNPSIRFNNPTSGRYEIWIGSYQQGQNSEARLHISEISSQ